MPPGIYKNLKRGTEHRLLFIAKHSETLEDMVVYEELSKNELSQFWVRPLSLFKEKFVFLREK
jgi:hypothetical protein